MQNMNIILVVILLGGWLGGKITQRIGLPAILGMLLFGIAVGAPIRSGAPGIFWELDPMIRSAALVIILLRSGLGIRKAALARSGKSALLLAVIPCLAEGSALTLLFYYVWGFELFSAGTAGFLLSAVSPAVVVPSMLNLMEHGYGRANEVPTTVLTGASGDDVLAITLCTLFMQLASGAVSTEEINITAILLRIPASIIGAVAIGSVIGLTLAAYFKRRHTSIRATEKFMILVALSIMFVEVGSSLHLASLLGVMTIGFILLERCEHIAHELAGKLSKAWVIAEILLFVLIGIAVNPQAALTVGLPGIGAVVVGLTARSAGVLLSLAGSPLTRPERLFCVIAYIPKATVQAALGAVPLAMGIAHGETILSLAVLSILVTAPAGLLGIRLLGPRLLGQELRDQESILYKDI